MFQIIGPSHKALLAIAVPMILSNITVPLLGLVDTAVVGHLSAPYYLGGVAIGSMIITFIFAMAGFLRMATTGVTAQAFGSDNAEGQLASLIHGLAIAVILALAIVLLQWPIKLFSFWLAGGSAQVQHYGQLYFSIRILSAPAVLINLVLLGWMLGMQTARGAMWHLILTNVINIGLDMFFVFGLGWDVAGVAWATVIADYCGVLIGFYFVLMILKTQQIDVSASALRFWQHWAAIKPLLLINRDIFLRTFCLLLSFAFMTFEGANLGDTIVAANAILLNLLTLIAFALDGIAYAVEALVGKALGKKSKAELLRAIKDALLWSILFGLFFTGLFALFGGTLLRIMSDIPSVIAAAELYLPWLVVMPLISLWCYLYDGIFIGLTRAKDMRDSTFIATFIGFFAVWWVTQQWGNHALWFALSCFMVLRGLTLALRFRYLLRHVLFQ